MQGFSPALPPTAQDHAGNYVFKKKNNKLYTKQKKNDKLMTPRGGENKKMAYAVLTWNEENILQEVKYFLSKIKAENYKFDSEMNPRKYGYKIVIMKQEKLTFRTD